MQQDNDNDWLLVQVATGLQKLSCLSLDRTPAAEVLVGTAQAWHEALTLDREWDEKRDAGRIYRAFVILARNMRRWPAPSEFMDALPPVEVKALGCEVRPLPPEEARKRAEEVRSLLTGIVDAVPPAKPEREVSAEDKARIAADLRRHYDRKAAAAGPDA